MIRRFLKSGSDPDSDASDSTDGLADPFADDYAPKPVSKDEVVVVFDRMTDVFSGYRCDVFGSFETDNLRSARITLDIETDDGKTFILVRTF